MRCSGGITRCAAEAGRLVVVDHPGCLHEGVTRGRSHEPAAEFLERTTQRVRYFGRRGRLRIRRARRVYGRAIDERPHEFRQRAMLGLDSLNRAGAGNGRRNLCPVPDDAGIEQEFRGIRFGEGGDSIDIEVMKQCFVALSLIQDRGP